VLHAGWRGVLAGVIQAGLAALGPPSGAWIGPSIHSCCYRVGPEVVAAFRAAGLPVAGPDRVDPGRAAAHVLEEGGVREVAISRDCTYCSPHYFSYRRDGVTGRQGAFTALLNGA
jgi:polyphenol oxidase